MGNQRRGESYQAHVVARHFLGWKYWCSLLDKHFGFHSIRNVAFTGMAASLLCGLASLWRGQDSNWDQRNYHLHNAWAWLNGRVGLDLAPAQMQSYFNPIIDVPYYLMSIHWPPPLVGFVMGFLHGLAFLPLSGIAWQFLATHPARAQLAPLLAAAGCCSAVFLAELGTTMGDVTTAPFVLGALWLLLRKEISTQETSQVSLIAAGVLLGVALALKLTNVIFAPALALALLIGNQPWRQRLGNATLLTVSAMMVFAAMAGPWLWQMWLTFGNPLFPQFNNWFQSPLALPISIADTRRLPHTWSESLTWPLVLTFNPSRFSEKPMPQITLGLLYLLALVAILMRCWRWRVSQYAMSVNPSHMQVFIFVAATFVLWTAMFSIHRYLVVLELLAPILIWWLLVRLLTAARARKWASKIVLLTALVGLFGWADWGHEPWTENPWQMQMPVIETAEQSSVILIGDAPQSWRLLMLPPALQHLSVGSNFPATPNYAAKVKSLLQQREGPIYAMLPAEFDTLPDQAVRLSNLFQRLGLADADRGCSSLRWLVKQNRKFEVEVHQDGGTAACKLVVHTTRRRNIAAENQQWIDHANILLQKYNLNMSATDCQLLDSQMGGGHYPFQWCRVRIS